MKKTYKIPKSMILDLDIEDVILVGSKDDDGNSMGIEEGLEPGAKSRLFSSDDDDWGINIVDMN